MSGGSGMLGLAESGIVKTAVVGALAVVALFMMFMMVRKAGKAAPLPTAEELVGIPPALQGGSDVVGEADESETAMAGIEVDSDELKTQKMLEEVTELVKSNPSGAAQIMGRWLQTES
jgi:flagellar biosynthesis/type III secretory pathway M-ring protein FliF/YscJ